MTPWSFWLPAECTRLVLYPLLEKGSPAFSLTTDRAYSWKQCSGMVTQRRQHEQTNIIPTLFHPLKTAAGKPVTVLLQRISQHISIL